MKNQLTPNEKKKASKKKKKLDGKPIH